MLRPVRTVAPTVYPISLDEAKKQVGAIGFTDDDELLEGLIAAACSRLDGRTGITGLALINQTWRQDFSDFCSPLRLALQPVSAVSGVSYYNASNNSGALSASIYQVLTDELGTYLALAYGQTWPTVYSRADAVSVTYVAGYGATGEAVPPELRAAMLLMVGHLYENREAVVVGNINAIEVPMGVDALIAPFRRIGI